MTGKDLERRGQQEILPPERPLAPHGTLVPSHIPNGMLKGLRTGFVSAWETRGIDAHNRKRRAQLETIEIDTLITIALQRGYLEWRKLQDIENIADAEQRAREMQRYMAALIAKKEILDILNDTERIRNEAAQIRIEADRLTQLARANKQKYERDNEQAASLAEQQRWANKAAEEEAHGRYLAKRRDRLVTETISQTVINTQAELQKATNTEAKVKLTRALGILSKIARQSQPQLKTTDETALHKLAATFKHRMALAKDRHNNEEYGIYAQALAEVEEQLAK